jgi:hypothetical protein
MKFLIIAGVLLATTGFGRVAFLYLEARAKYWRRMRRSN